MAVIYALGILANFIYTRLMAVVTQKFLDDMRKKVFNGMQSLPIRYFDTHTNGDIMSHYTNDIDAIRQMVSQSLPQVFISLIMLTVISVVMLYYSLWLTLIVVAFTVILVLVAKAVGGRSAKYFVAQQRTTGKAEGFMEETVGGQKVIKVFNHEEEAKEAFDKVNEELFDAAKNANTFANMLMPIMGNIGNFMYVLLAFVGSLIIIYDGVNVGLSGVSKTAAALIPVVVGFLTMGRQFTGQISQVSNQLNAIVMALAGAQRIYALMDEKPEEDNGYVTLVNIKYGEDGNIIETNERTNLWAWKHPHKADGTITYVPLKGDIEMHNVDFGYVPEKIVLHDVSLHASPGEKYAFVGATGAGKTTITNLLNRFYDIADGKIRYDGININKIKKADLRRSLGVVLQDTCLFTGTIMENIRYGRLDATDEEVYEAAKIANAHDFITRLPDGYDTMLTNDGTNLSQGQRQLLAIARAAVADAPVMIMDEATSSIDTRTERLVQEGTDRLMKGRTVFVIAHRLSTVQNSDTIMVLDKGRVIERGSHEELLKEKGAYYARYTGALELE
ncbi:MAG: ABC transporter ATP-binding protein, partial [Clostridia bacterium]|nr:ABC transporter ATP-binding protein [Clostridia bacterium]